MCSFVRLKEKSQDNISKQAAVEKEPLTPEKGKSYPKPPVLNMKWANCNINVVEWANIPKFIALDDLVTLVRLLELFFMTY